MYDAIYFVSPTDESIQSIVGDFKKKNMYATANIFFTNSNYFSNFIIYK